MKIDAIFQTKINKSCNAKKYNKDLAIKSLQYDMVTFKGKDKSNPLRLPAVLLAALGLASCGNAPQGQTVPPVSEQVATETSSETTQPTGSTVERNETSSPDKVKPQEDKLKEDLEFQLKQVQDTPSLTFDFSYNLAPEKLKPSRTSVVLAQNPDKNNEYSNLNDIATRVYGIEETDVQSKWLVGQSILKANPWMIELVAKDIVDYTKGDLTNIDPEMILSTDYSTEATEGKSIYLPEVNVLVRTGKKNEAYLSTSVEFTAMDEDQNDKTELLLKKEDFAKATTYEKQVEILDEIIGHAYRIEHMSSYAGQAIWHGIAIDEENYEIFAKSSESDTKKALLNYLNKEGEIELVLPRVGVTSIDLAVSGAKRPNVVGQKEDEAMDELLAPRDSKVTISYLTPDRAVFDLSEFEDKDIRMIDILDTIRFADGTSLKEAYEADPATYEGIVLAAVRQQMDNNNILINTFNVGDICKENPITILYSPMKNFDSVEPEGCKINLQPIAFAHVGGGSAVSSDKKPGGGTNQNKPVDPDPTDPTDPTKPTDPTEPTGPTEPSEPTEPTEPDCGELPDVVIPGGGIGDIGGPGLDEPGKENEECPTEPSQPPTSEGDKNTGTGDIEVEMP